MSKWKIGDWLHEIDHLRNTVNYYSLLVVVEVGENKVIARVLKSTEVWNPATVCATDYNLVRTSNRKLWKARLSRMGTDLSKPPLKRSKNHSLKKRDWMEGLSVLHSKVQYGTVSSLLLFKTGEYQLKHDAVCNKWLSYTPPAHSLYLVTKVKESALKDRRTVAWIEWMLKDSNWSSFILNKSVDDVFKRGLITRTDVDHGLLQQAHNILRHIWEYHGIVRTWNKLVREGINKELAFFYAYSFHPTTSNKYKKQLRSYEHNIFDMTNISKEMMKNFIKHKVIGLRPTFYEDPVFKGVWKVYGVAGLRSEYFLLPGTDGSVKEDDWDAPTESPTVSFDLMVSHARMIEQEWMI